MLARPLQVIGSPVSNLKPVGLSAEYKQRELTKSTFFTFLLGLTKKMNETRTDKHEIYLPPTSYKIVPDTCRVS
jgi:hypothetical protein